MFNLNSTQIAYNPSPSTADFHPVKLPGENYIANSNIFPSRVVSGYHAEIAKYNADTWAEYVLEKSKGVEGTATSICSALNSGSTGGRYWFGYVYGGGPISAKDFAEADKKSEVDGARAFST